jgi:hypothetical protein
VTAIRAADSDDNPDTMSDPAWTSYLGTPAFPSYVSGHSGHSAAAAAVLASFFGSDAASFSLSTDSLPGVTRSFASFSAAAQEVSDSRVYAGIHWRFDVVAGETLGYEVGNYIVGHLLLPASRSKDQDGDDGGTATVASGPADPAPVAAIVTLPSGVSSDTRSRLILVFAPPAAPAGTVSPATPTPQPAAPVPPNDLDALRPGVPSPEVSSNGSAGPALWRARKPAGAGALADGLVEGLPAGDSLEAGIGVEGFLRPGTSAQA